MKIKTKQSLLFLGTLAFFYFGLAFGLPKILAQESGLVAYWALDENSGTTATDSAESNTGTLVNEPSWTTGKYNSALLFDGTNDYVDLGTSDFNLTDSLTVSAWVKVSSANGGYATIIGRGQYVYPFWLQLDIENKVRFGIRTTAVSYLITDAHLDTGQWYHLAATYQNGERIIYINGQPSKSDALTGTLYQKSGEKTILGNTPNSTTYFNGAIDDIRVYNRALSAPEILDLYNNIPIAAPACTASWSCGAWTDCQSNGNQTRVCTDSNSCDTTANKPTETQNCIYASPISGNKVEQLNSDGTKIAEFSTIQECANVVSAGQTCLAYPGTYRETVIIKNSGTTNQPITFQSASLQQAIIDGSDLLNVSWTKCAAASDCGGNANWNNIYYTTLAQPISIFTPLYENDEFLWFAQDPNQPDPFWWDEIDNYYVIPLGDPNVKHTMTTLTDPRHFTQSDPHYYDGAYIALWHSNNRVTPQKILSYNPQNSTVTFEPGDISSIYTDRDSYYSIINHLSILDKVGEYSFDNSTNKLYLWPRDPADLQNNKITIGKRGYGIKFLGKSNLVIDGFKVQNQFGDVNQWFTGLGITDYGSGGTESNVTIKNNKVYHIRGMVGAGAIHLQHVDNGVIDNNLVTEDQKSTGIWFGGNNLTVKNNTVTRIGRVGIWARGAKNSQILFNYIDDILGGHSDAAAIYSGSENVLVYGNQIYNSNVGFSIEEGKNLWLINNIVNLPETTNTVVVWSDWTGTFNLLNNVFLGSKNNNAITIDTTRNPDILPIIKNNIIDGMGVPTTNTQRSHNIYTSLLWNQTSHYGWSLGVGEVDWSTKNLNQIFVNPSGNNYRLVQTGPAINTGTDITAYLPTSIFPDFDFSKDFAGASRPQGTTWDIGAYEYPEDTPAPVCVPNWSCTSWSTCSASNNQIRTCTDLSACGVTTGKPTESQSCTYTPPVANCTPNWSCTTWNSCSASKTQGRTCTDTKYCNTDSGKPIESQGCTYTAPGGGGTTGTGTPPVTPAPVFTPNPTTTPGLNQTQSNPDDSDNDGLTDQEETNFGTDPLNWDTDYDSYNDKEEIDNGFDPLKPTAVKNTNLSLINKLKGYILLQVQRNGESWWVHPVDGLRYYLRNGAVAYQIMRFLSLGITDADLAKIPEAGSNSSGDVNLVNRLKGYILLQVQQNGEAWYVNPFDGKRYYLRDGEAAYQIMRFHSLGITNIDLNTLPIGELRGKIR